MNTIDFFRLSEAAIDFINKNIRPIMSPDYIGYIIPLPKRFKCVLAVDYDGKKTWSLVPANIKKNLKVRQAKRAIKFLLKTGWIIPANSLPFEEFEHDLILDKENAIIISEKEATATNKLMDKIIPPTFEADDDISGIDLL